MTDREIRSQLYQMAKANGVELPDSFGMGDGSFNGSTGCSELAKKIYESMRNLIRSQIADPSHKFKKTIVSLAELVAELDKPKAGINLMGIERKYDKIKTEIKAPKAERDTITNVINYLNQTKRGLIALKTMKADLIPAEIVDEMVVRIDNTVAYISENVVDGASIEALQVAQGIADTLYNLRRDAHNAVITTDMAPFDKIDTMVREWAKYVAAPSKASRARENEVVAIYSNDPFSTNEKVGFVYSKGNQFFAVIEKRREIVHSLEKVDGQINDLKAQSQALDAELKAVALAVKNGKLTIQDFTNKKKEVDAKKAEIEKKLKLLNQTSLPLRVQVKSIMSIITTYEQLRTYYDFFFETSPENFVNLFGEQGFNYSDLITALSSANAENLTNVRAQIGNLLVNVTNKAKQIFENDQSLAEAWNNYANEENPLVDMESTITEGLGIVNNDPVVNENQAWDELNALLGDDAGGTVINNEPVSAGAEVLDEDPLADLNSLINGDN